MPRLGLPPAPRAARADRRAARGEGCGHRRDGAARGEPGRLRAAPGARQVARRARARRGAPGAGRRYRRGGRRRAPRKPADEDAGVAMLERLSGRTHRVLTAVALARAHGAPGVRLSESAVRFRSLTRAEGVAYWRTGEGRDKAGGYAIQGRGALFIEHLS